MALVEAGCRADGRTGGCSGMLGARAWDLEILSRRWRARPHLHRLFRPRRPGALPGLDRPHPTLAPSPSPSTTSPPIRAAGHTARCTRSPSPPWPTASSTRGPSPHCRRAPTSGPIPPASPGRGPTPLGTPQPWTSGGRRRSAEGSFVLPAGRTSRRRPPGEGAGDGSPTSWRRSLRTAHPWSAAHHLWGALFDDDHTSVYI